MALPIEVIGLQSLKNLYGTGLVECLVCFQALEHCISDFLDKCDIDDNHDITLKVSNILKVTLFNQLLFGRAENINLTLTVDHRPPENLSLVDVLVDINQTALKLKILKNKKNS